MIAGIVRAAIIAVMAACAFVTYGAAAADARKPGEVFRDCKVCPEMVVIPAGSYVMGRDGRHEYEAPPHPVTLAQPFAMGRHEVTFDEWEACFNDGGCARVPDDHTWGRGRRPVINVAWDEAFEFIRWLSRKTDKTYRLPSEAEWEWAASAGTRTKFWWGDEPGQNLANCRDCGSQWSKKGSAPVGSFAANPFGLFDTAGNVWEWMADCWNPSHAGAPADGSARLDGDCSARVMRSGSWYYIAKNVSSTWRFKNLAAGKSYGIGFRVARDLP